MEAVFNVGDPDEADAGAKQQSRNHPREGGGPVGEEEGAEHLRAVPVQSAQDDQEPRLGAEEGVPREAGREEDEGPRGDRAALHTG